MMSGLGSRGLPLMALLASLLMPASASAASIHIDDLTDVVTISWDGFLTFNFNDTPMDPSGSASVPETAIGPTFVFNGTWAGSGPAGEYIIRLLEPGSGSFGPISDIIQASYPVDVFGQHIYGGFQSDFEDNLFLGPGIEETGGYQLLNEVLGNPVGLDIFVRSDCEGCPQPPEVPEPASLFLLGSGLVFGARRWRKRG